MGISRTGLPYTLKAQMSASRRRRLSNFYLFIFIRGGPRVIDVKNIYKKKKNGIARRARAISEKACRRITLYGSTCV